MANDSGINQKGKFGQFFCRHTNAEWYRKKEVFQNLSGDRHYKICKDCGFKVDERFVRHD